MTVSKGIRKCISHNFQLLLLLVPFKICLLYLKNGNKNDLVYMKYFED